MAGLSVLLESDDSGKALQVISKATLHSPKISLSPASRAAAAAAVTSSFLQRCSLCRKELAEDSDIYMYRGDRAFCSVECRCRQMFMDEEDAGGSSYCGANNGAAAAAARTSGRRRGRATRDSASGGGGGFA